MESSEPGSIGSGWKTGAMDRSYEDIVYEVADPVAMITLDRPAVLNAFTYSMLREIREAVETAGEWMEGVLEEKEKQRRYKEEDEEDDKE